MYATASDDKDIQEQSSSVPPVGSEYEAIDMHSKRHPAPTDTGQNTAGNSPDRLSMRPPLPSMQSRLAKAQQQQEEYVEPSSSTQGQASQEEGEGVYAEVSSVRSSKVVEYTDDFTSQENKNAQHEESVYSEGSSESNDSISSPDTVTLRSRNSLISKNIPTATTTENGLAEDEDEVDDGGDADVFAELEQALASQDTPDLNLSCPLTEEDYLPVKELHVFLVNNSHLLSGVSHRHKLLDSDEDPVDSLKTFLKEMQI